MLFGSFALSKEFSVESNKVGTVVNFLSLLSLLLLAPGLSLEQHTHLRFSASLLTKQESQVHLLVDLTAANRPVNG